jgi:hypothetical protein
MDQKSSDSLMKCPRMLARLEDAMAGLGKADELRRNKFLFVDDVPQLKLSSHLMGLLPELWLRDQ